MNPYANRSISPLQIIRSVTDNRHLIYSLVKRDVLGRYRGTAMGLLWSFFNPVLMLAVYTFVFSVVLKTRWTGGSESKAEYALVLFAGLIVFNLFSECINRAPSLILSNANYVKKVVFPLEVLPIVTIGSALFHFLISLLVWGIFYGFFFGFPPRTIFYLPFVIFPLFMQSLGMGWFLASIGVYLRDVAQIVGVLTSILLFLSPIFYPASALPEQYRILMNINPITFVVEQARNAMLFNVAPSWFELIGQTFFSLFVSWFGFSWFQKTRKGFADVI